MAFSLPMYSVVTGRGSSAIYFVLRRLGMRDGCGRRLLAPANVCYAALYPALYAGWELHFIDVSDADGNVMADDVRNAVDLHHPDAILAPHMYGQPIAELPAIAELCEQRGIVLIEDCASSMGATADYPVGLLGDYAVYSTGYAKVVDLGYGGILASKSDDLNWVSVEEAALPLRDEQIEATETLFGKMYRTLRSFPDGRLDREVYRILPEAARDAFLFRLGPDDARRVEDAPLQVDDIVASKRNLFRECLQLWNREVPVGTRVFPYAEGAVPWRFTFFADPALRPRVIEACLRESLPISDWYPRVTPMFGDEGAYPRARAMEQSILNIPLDSHVGQNLSCVAAIVSELQKGSRS